MLIAPLGVITIAQALVSALEQKGKNKFRQYAKLIIVASAIIFLISTSIPINTEYYTLTAYERQTEIEMANYLNTLPNTTVVYSGSGQLIPIYMHFDNTSRLRGFDGITNCTSIAPKSYITLPRYSDPYGLLYIPDPQKYCPNWQLVLVPPPYNTSDKNVIAMGAVDQLALYYVPANKS